MKKIYFFWSIVPFSIVVSTIFSVNANNVILKSSNNNIHYRKFCGEEFEITQKEHIVVFGNTISFKANNNSGNLASLVLYKGEKELKSETGDIAENIVISFLDSLSFQFNENTSWSIRGTEKDIILKSGFGPINNFLFPSPGNYNIEISETNNHVEGTCNHDNYPKKITVRVSPIKMIFDFAKINFSSEIVGGQSQYSNEISVDVYVESYNNDKAIFYTGKVTSAGIGVDIEGTLKNDGIALKQGINHLVYKLKGQATHGTYIMFDFLDINNQTVSYTYPKIIK